VLIGYHETSGMASAMRQLRIKKENIMATFVLRLEIPLPIPDDLDMGAVNAVAEGAD
jgi:hypothetical protein